MRAILLDPPFAQSLVARGYENAARFDWDKSAERLNSIVGQVIR